MMPLADAFNHKAAKVQLSGDYALDPMCLAADSDDSSSDGDDGQAEVDGDEDGKAAPGEHHSSLIHTCRACLSDAAKHTADTCTGVGALCSISKHHLKPPSARTKPITHPLDQPKLAQATGTF